jgi:hypothetical protein
MKTFNTDCPVIRTFLLCCKVHPKLVERPKPTEAPKKLEVPVATSAPNFPDTLVQGYIKHHWSGLYE